MEQARKPNLGVISGESSRGPRRVGYSLAFSQPETRPSCPCRQLEVSGCTKNRMDVPGLTSSPRMRGRAGSRSPRAILQEEQQVPEAETRPDGCQGRGTQKSGSKGAPEGPLG